MSSKYSNGDKNGIAKYHKSASWSMCYFFFCFQTTEQTAMIIIIPMQRRQDRGDPSKTGRHCVNFHLLYTVFGSFVQQIVRSVQAGAYWLQNNNPFHISVSIKCTQWRGGTNYWALSNVISDNPLLSLGFIICTICIILTNRRMLLLYMYIHMYEGMYICIFTRPYN